MQLVSWRIGFCLAILARVCPANAGTIHGGAGLESCSTMVHYYAIAGSPLRAENSSVFRGFIHVEDQRKQKIHKEATLSWTFPKGETIRTGDNVFRDPSSNGAHARGNLSSSLSRDESMAQRVEIKYLTDGQTDNFGFVVEKSLSGMGSGTGYGFGPLTSVEHNGMKCKQVARNFNHMSWQLNNASDTHLERNVLSLEYLPMEKRNCLYGSGCDSNSTDFILRLTNTGMKPIDLKDVVLEYWFDKGTAMAGASASVFDSGCHVATEGVDTEDIIVSVQHGYRGVFGAQYKAVISFLPNVGYLRPKRHTSLFMGTEKISMSKRRLDHLEAGIKIVSLQPQTYFDATKDYSFQYCEPAKNQTDPEHVTRKFAVNPKVPVILHDELVSGARPKSTTPEEKQASESAHFYGLETLLRDPYSELNATYCCSKPEISQKWSPLCYIVFGMLAILIPLSIIRGLYYFQTYILHPCSFWRQIGVGTLRVPTSHQSATSSSLLSSLIDSNLIYRNVNYETEIEPYLTRGNLLGQGGYGRVYHIEFRDMDVAIKVVDVQDKDLSKCTEEINLASCLNHEYNVKLMGAFLWKKSILCLIMEFVNGGNLSKRIHDRNRPPLEYIEVLNIGLDIARGLEQLHPKIVHMDLNPKNVLYTDVGRCKIADFGLSRRMEDHDTHLSLSKPRGTLCYMAPEILDNLRVNDKCDVYSFGCILYEAIAQQRPFAELSDHRCILAQIVMTVVLRNQRPLLPGSCPPNMAHLIQSCWEKDTKNRPNASDLVARLENMIKEEQSKAQQETPSPPMNGSHATTSCGKVTVQECELV